MAVRPNAAARQGIVTSGYSIFDGGTLTYRTGSQPDDGGATATGTNLGSATIPDPAFGTGSGGARGPATQWDVQISETGTIGWARLEGDGGAIIDYSCGGSGSGAEIEIGDDGSGNSVTVGQIVRVNSGNMTLPGNDAA